MAPSSPAAPPYANEWEREISDALRVAQRTYALPDLKWDKVGEDALQQATSLDVRVAEALAVVDLPMLAGLTVDTFLNVRESDEAFAAWRADLRLTTRMLREITDRPTFIQDAQALFEDVLVPRAEVVRRSLSRSAALRTAMREQPIRTSLGAVAAAAATGTGAPPEGAIVSASAAGVAQLLAAMFLRPKPTGSAAILAKLV